MEDQARRNDEITLRDMILKIQEFIAYYWTKKWWLIGAGIIGAAIFVYRVYDEPETFEGNLTFVVDEGGGGGSAGVGAILGQFGLGGDSGENTLAKVATLARSRNVIYDMLMDSVSIEEETDLLANHFIRTNNLNEWFLKISPTLDGYQFPHNRRAEFKRRDLMVLKLIHLKLILSQDPLMKVDWEDETGIVSLTVQAQSEGLTLALLYGNYEELQSVFVHNAVGRQQATLAQLRSKADSVSTALAQTEYQLASQEDRSLGLTSRRDLVKIQQLSRKAALLNGMYIEVLKSKETAEFMLSTNLPTFNIIDPPAVPLASLEIKPIKAAVLGGIFGGFVCVLILGLIKGYRDIMAGA